MADIALEERGPARGHGSALGNWWHTVDRWSLGAVVSLFAIGIVLGLAASPPLAQKNGLWTYHYVVRHVFFAAVAMSLILGVSMQAPRRVRRGGVLVFAGALAATALLPWLGTDFGKGAVRWYSLGFMSLQPSEFLKPGFVIAAAWLMSGAYEKHGPPGRTISGLAAGGIAAMLALQPDFGQAVLVLGVWSAMIFVSGAPMVLLVGLVGLLGAAGAFAYANSSHFAGRIDGFLAAEVDPNTQLAYAQSAIREGGFFGVGAAQGSVKWTLPDAHTDFIIAVAAEEFGLILTLIVIALYLFITLRALARLSEERQPFVRLAGSGLAVMLGLQAFVNMAVAIRLLPAKGMTLPFISYGGSSMMAGALAMGALLALTRRRPHDAAAELLDRA
ncbi:MAG TPA: putative peptidoglycan glycosyltransferase FtsW [Thermohalobaculum sp.]|nr:putative peptidoglycan glycosyltransferase FtsW [Thermohalobaculum sp.]